MIDIEAKPEITFDDFGKMQFQVGEIISCEAVKKSKKLLCSQVKIGSQVKQIVSGIKKHYSAEEMVGKKVMVLVNLKPAKLAGVLSEGMLAKEYPFVYAAVGIHPDEVGSLNEETFAQMKELFKEEKVVAVGEIGLDYYWDNEPREVQKKNGLYGSWNWQGSWIFRF